VGAGAAHAVLIPLQSATSTVEQTSGDNVISRSIDGQIFVDPGWGLQKNTDVLKVPQAGVWETQNDAAHATWTFNLYHRADFGIEQPLGRISGFTYRKIKLSYTTDDRSTFADGIGARNPRPSVDRRRIRGPSVEARSIGRCGRIKPPGRRNPARG